MTQTTEYTIGTDVSCSDGACGQLTRVVVDPIARTLTHLVVEPKHGPAMGHLVPIDLATTADTGIHLRCTTAEFDALEDAEETKFLPGASGQWSYPQERIMSWPYYGLAAGGTGGLSAGMGGMGIGMGLAGPQSVVFDRVPTGDVEMRRGDRVHATDGEIGKVQGLVVDPADHHVTHLLLDEGHLWGRKRVAIPINAVASVDHGVHLKLTKDDVRNLPPIHLDEEVDGSASS